MSTPKLRLTTAASALVLALAAPAAIAQNSTGGAPQDVPMDEKISNADAPEMAETDAANEPDGMSGRMMMLDVENYAQNIYERGFRQGYIRGMMEARDRFAEQVRMIRDQAARDDYVNPSTQNVTGDQGNAAAIRGETQQAQSGASQGAMQNGQMQQQADAGTGQATPQGDPRLTDDVFARPGGAIILLPEGMDMAQLLQQIEDGGGRMQVIQNQSGNN